MQAAKKSAEGLVEKYSLRAPFSVASVSKNFGIVVKEYEEEEFTEEVGQIIRGNEIPEELIAYYDQSSQNILLLQDDFNTPPTQRYIVAFILGEIVLHKNGGDIRVHRSDISPEAKASKSEENNYFAQHLLMPDQDMKEKLEVLNFYKGEAIITKMAKVFKVSINLMRSRLQLYKKENPAIWEKLNLNKSLF